jgi:hypothetical protein
MSKSKLPMQKKTSKKQIAVRSGEGFLLLVVLAWLIIWFLGRDNDNS